MFCVLLPSVWYMRLVLLGVQRGYALGDAIQVLFLVIKHSS